MRPETFNTLQRYLTHGVQPGGAMVALLSDELFETVARSDTGRLSELADIVRFVYNEFPLRAWGSRQKVDAWIAAGGEVGIGDLERGIL